MDKNIKSNVGHSTADHGIHLLSHLFGKTFLRVGLVNQTRVSIPWRGIETDNIKHTFTVFFMLSVMDWRPVSDIVQIKFQTEGRGSQNDDR